MALARKKRTAPAKQRGSRQQPAPAKPRGSRQRPATADAASRQMTEDSIASLNRIQARFKGRT
ncbi:MAG: hypothetical protein OER56_14620, partial [Hyphomicrobiales bacterium]|nr:hypothetical protein [Hyphomicrobiales bacterium]